MHLIPSVLGTAPPIVEVNTQLGAANRSDRNTAIPRGEVAGAPTPISGPASGKAQLMSTQAGAARQVEPFAPCLVH